MMLLGLGRHWRWTDLQSLNTPACGSIDRWKVLNVWYHRVVPRTFLTLSILVCPSMVSTSALTLRWPAIVEAMPAERQTNMGMLMSQGNIWQVPCNRASKMRWPHTQMDWTCSLTALPLYHISPHSSCADLACQTNPLPCSTNSLDWTGFGSSQPTLSSSHFLTGFMRFRPTSFQTPVRHSQKSPSRG